MPFSVRSRPALVLCGVLLPVIAACGPSPAPPSAAPPPPPAASASAAASGSTSASTAEPPAAPPNKGETAGVDYGAPPNARCIDRERISTPAAARKPAERKAERFALAKKVLEGGALFVEIDGRKAGVVVPPRYGVKRLVLVIGHNLPQPIPDLAVDAGGFSGELLFNRTRRFSVRVPWDAVYGLAGEDGRATRWIEDVPADVLCEEDEPLDVEVEE